MVDGLYDLEVVTTDNVGNTFTSALVTNVLVDNTGPAGSITAPAPSSVVTGSGVTVSSDNADPASGIATVQFQYSPAGTATWSNIGAALVSGPYSVIWDTTLVPDGPYDLRVVATDVLGNISKATATDIFVDNTAPTGSITAPVTAELVSGGGVTVSSDSADAGSGVASAAFDYSPAGLNVWLSIGVDTSSPFSLSWDTTDLANGFYDLRVTTTDNAGHVTTSATMPNVHVDNSAPALAFGSFTNSSATGDTVFYLPGSSGGFTVTATPWKHSPPVDHVQFPDLGTGWTGGGASASPPYEGVYTFDSSAVEPGGGQGVTVVDTFAGVSYPANFTALADGAPPTSSISCNGGACSGWFPSAVSVTLSAVDTGSGVAQIKYTTDGTPPGLLNGTVYSGAFLVPTSATVEFRAYDLLGNEEAVGSQMVQIDSIAPTGSITAPAAGATVYSTAFAVSSDSADTGGSGLATTSFQYSPAGAGTWTLIGTDTTSPYAVSWNAAALSAGDYDLRVISIDGAGNSFTGAAVTVHVPAALVFRASKARLTKKAGRATITVQVKVSVPATLRSTLFRGRKVVFRWKNTLKAGSRRLRLTLLKRKLRSGRDKLVMVATSAGAQRATRSLYVRVPLRF
jgi:large repetitive protein